MEVAPPVPNVRDAVAAAWHARAAELADWALARFFVRTDRHGGYRIDGEKVTRPEAGCEPGAVCRDLLVRHFRACRPRHVFGAHSLTAGEPSVGRTASADIDAKGEAAESPAVLERNRKYAEALYAKLTGIGFRPLLVRWDKGSYHLHTLFDRDAAGERLYAFARWIVSDAGAHGFGEPVEAFPKQPAVPAGKCGNWLRLVGRHHKRDVWAEVFDGVNWLEGAAAVAHVLSLTGDSPDLIPPDVEAHQGAGNGQDEREPGGDSPPAPAGARRRDDRESVFVAYNRSALLPDMVEHCKARGHKLIRQTADRADFRRAGKSADESFNLQIVNGVVFLKNFSCNSGLPEGPGLNPSNARCALMFGDTSTASFAKLGPILERELGWPSGDGKPTRPVAPTRGESESADPPEGAVGDAGEEPAPTYPPPDPGEAWDDPHRLARLFLAGRRHADGPTLIQWRGEWWRWNGSAWGPVPDAELDAELARHARAVFAADLPARIERAQKAAEAKGKGRPKKLPSIYPVTTGTRGNVRLNLGGLVNVPDDGRSPPFWLDGRDGPNPAAVVSAPNGLFRLPDIAAGLGPFSPPTPCLFTPNAIPFDVPRDPGRPDEWLRRLDQWFSGDPAAIAGLQEWFGYFLSAETCAQKALLLVGPPRSGKGTIMHVLGQVVGTANVASTTFAALGDRFGLENLLGKRVTMIPDARITPRTDATAAVERILSITGEDVQSVDRKNRPCITARIDTRFVIGTNVMPQLPDASGAVATRFIILHTPNSYLGKEDHTLKGKLQSELPAVLKWAAEGWVRLCRQGMVFTPNDAAKAHHRELEDLSNPVKAFLRERCNVGPAYSADTKEVFGAWVTWNKQHGKEHVPAESVFGRDLRATLPQVHRSQRRDGGRLVSVYKGVSVREEMSWGESDAPEAA